MRSERPNLPAPVAAYFAADTAGDVDALLQSFADGAVVRDEGTSHAGPEEIRAWWRAAKAKYCHGTEPLSASVDDGALIVSGRVTGDFPGSPATLSYAFTLEEGRILRLEIGG